MMISFFAGAVILSAFFLPGALAREGGETKGPGPARDPAAGGAPASWVDRIDQRVRELQPTRAERRFDEIGWVKDITENNDARPGRIEKQTLRAQVVRMGEGRARARLDGSVRLRHPFYPGREDGRTVNADVAGYMDFDPETREVLSFRLVTEKATYGPGTLEVAVRSLPSPPPREY